MSFTEIKKEAVRLTIKQRRELMVLLAGMEAQPAGDDDARLSQINDRMDGGEYSTRTETLRLHRQLAASGR